MESLTEQELILLKEFRERISDVLYEFSVYQSHDLSLVRYLRARELDLDRAEQMLRKCLKWRKDNDIDNLLGKKLTADHETNYPVKICGVDKRGFPVLLAQCGIWDFRKAMESGLKQSFISYVVRFFEQCFQICAHLSTPEKFVGQIVAVLDFEGFSFRQLTSKDGTVWIFIEAMCEIVSTFEANYPELLRVAFVINAPTIFQILWAVIKPMLTKRTLAKIHIIGSNKEAWRSEVFKVVNADNFPSQFGGAINVTLDYKFNYGLDVFPTYEVFPEQELTTIGIEARDKYTIDVMMEADWTLSWNFKTTDQCDIGFSVDFEEDDRGHPPRQELVKNFRVQAHLYLQRGSILCKEAGKYTLTFDNSYSSFRGKTVRYAVRKSLPQNKTKMSSSSSSPFIENHHHHQSLPLAVNN